MQWCKLSQHIIVANLHTTLTQAAAQEVTCCMYVTSLNASPTTGVSYQPDWVVADFLRTNRLVLQLKVTTEINTGTLDWESGKDRWYIWLQVPYHL